MCSFSILKIPHCPPMFIWMTLVQSQHPAGLLSSQRRRGRPPGSRTCNSCKSHILQAFIQTSDVWGVPEWANTFFAPKRCADPRHKGTPSSVVSVPNIQHPLAYLLPRSPFNDLHPHSPWAWPSMVTTFTLFSPFAQSRLAWNSQKHSRKWDIRQNILLIYSLPFRFRHSVVFYCRRSIFPLCIQNTAHFRRAAKFSSRKLFFFLLIPHWPLEIFGKCQMKRSRVDFC